MSQPYYATIDAPCHRTKDEMLSEAFGAFLWIPTAEERVLKVFEWGGRPMFYYSMYTDRDLADIKRMYEAVKDQDGPGVECVRMLHDTYCARSQNVVFGSADEDEGGA